MRFFATLTFAMLLLAPTRNANGANDWLGAGSDSLWNNPDNWSEGFPPPDATTQPATGWDDPSGPFYPLTPDPSDDCPRFCNAAHLSVDGTTTLVDNTVTDATAYGLYVGFDGANNLLEVTGGSLTVGEWHLDVGRGFNRFANPDPTATLIMTGGTIDTALVKIPEQFHNPALADFYDTAPITGEMYMSGGVLNARKINVGQLVGDGRAEFSGTALVNLIPNVPGDPGNGGFLEMKQDWFIGGVPTTTISDAHIDIRDNALINIFGHSNGLQTTPDQSEVDRYQGYVNDGWLTADGETDVPTIYFGNNMIKICALDADFDSDCDVDHVDLATFQAGYGTTGTPGDLKASGDADNDGDVDGVDFLELQIEYGVGVEPLGAATNVPEPATLSLAAAFAVTPCLMGRGRRRHRRFEAWGKTCKSACSFKAKPDTNFCLNAKGCVL